jgi:hypothetical protein
MKSIYKLIVKVTDNKTAAFVYELPSVTQSGKIGREGLLEK